MTLHQPVLGAVSRCFSSAVDRIAIFPMSCRSAPRWSVSAAAHPGRGGAERRGVGARRSQCPRSPDPAPRSRGRARARTIGRLQSSVMRLTRTNDRIRALSSGCRSACRGNRRRRPPAGDARLAIAASAHQHDRNEPRGGALFQLRTNVETGYSGMTTRAGQLWRRSAHPERLAAARRRHDVVVSAGTPANRTGSLRSRRQREAWRASPWDPSLVGVRRVKPVTT